jgi:histidinol-phosphate aminotransferase
MWTAGAFDPFAMFAQQAGAGQQRVPLAADGSVSLDAMLAAITPDTRMIILVNPHNPTGTVVHGTDLRRFLDQVGDDVVVVLDEAYREFCDDPRVLDGVTLAQARWAEGQDNVVVVRTFSKAYGLAGLRVGYGIAPAPLARAVSDAGVPREIGIVAQAAAVAALKATKAMQENVARIIGERDRVLTELRRIGYSPPVSQANFIWLPLGEDSGRFVEHCFTDGVIVHEVADRGVRVSIGSFADNDCFLRSAHTWVTGKPAAPRFPAMAPSVPQERNLTTTGLRIPAQAPVHPAST